MCKLIKGENFGKGPLNLARASSGILPPARAKFNRGRNLCFAEWQRRENPSEHHQHHRVPFNEETEKVDAEDVILQEVEGEDSPRVVGLKYPRPTETHPSTHRCAFRAVRLGSVARRQPVDRVGNRVLAPRTTRRLGPQRSRRPRSRPARRDRRRCRCRRPQVRDSMAPSSSPGRPCR